MDQQKKMGVIVNEWSTLQGTIIYIIYIYIIYTIYTKREKENHGLKSAGWYRGYVIVPRRVFTGGVVSWGSSVRMDVVEPFFEHFFE